MTIFLKIILR
jgi:hypothetical protein